MLGASANATDEAGPRAPRAPAETRLRVSHEAVTGSFIELQPAAPGDTPGKTTFEHLKPTSIFVPLDAMTLLHPAFARAQPGFDLFVPALFDTAALGRLRTQLADFSKGWSSIATAQDAHKRYPLSAAIRGIKNDDEWLRARDALVSSIGEITTFVDEHEKKNENVWVLPAR